MKMDEMSISLLVMIAYENEFDYCKAECMREISIYYSTLVGLGGLSFK